MSRRSPVALSGVLALLLGGLLTACGTASPISRPAGVDELTVPTPSVSPRDFVAAIDNPWLPYAAGATWTYNVTGSTSGTLTIAVRATTEPVDGVAATVVDRTEPDGAVTTDYYAQDRRGNVWWLGEDGVWQAGQDGAEAGLVMPATPRQGDGWREAYAAGTVEDVASVVQLDGQASSPAGTFGDLVVIDTHSRLDPDGDRRSYYARGAGLVLEVSTSGAAYDAELLSAPGSAGAR